MRQVIPARTWALLLLAGLGGCPSASDPSTQISLGGEGGVPSSISQSIAEGDTSPRVVPLTLTNSGTCPLSYSVTASTATGGNWLFVSSGAWDAGTRPDLAANTSVNLFLGFDVVTPALRPGTYTGSLRIEGTCALTGTAATGSPATVPVNLTVTPNRAGIVVSDDEVEVDVVTLADTWTPMAPMPLKLPIIAAVWTGDAALFLNSFDPTRGVLYEPITDDWTPTSPATGPAAAPPDTAVVWTGRELLLLGGDGPITGRRYDPATDLWTSLSTTGAPGGATGLFYLTAVWTGSRMIVWGQRIEINVITEGGSYDPVTDTWTPISTVDAPAGIGHTAVWTGREMLIWEGYRAFGRAYDPSTDTWQPMSSTGAPSERSGHTAVWTGREMLIWGGLGEAGGAYDPALDLWTPIPSPPGTAGPWKSNCAVWTGAEMLIWGGSDSNNVKRPGFAWRPSTRTWRALSETGAPADFDDPRCLWTGTAMIAVGGTPVGAGAQPGGIYR